ncbi:MAG: MFS transporter [Armatimonadota bacterium]|nr:MFS transporter [Armatimonadota bacterium]
METSSTERNYSSPRALFSACCFALVVSAVAFGIRSNITGDLAKHFNTENQAVGWAIGGAFFGFGVSIFVGGQLCDWLGMKALLLMACVLQLAGIAWTIFAPSVFYLGVATWLIGLGNGLVEAAINPMVASLYPNEKTHRLNLLHVWWPGGIVIGGLIGFMLTQVNAPWQLKQAVVFIPAVIYGILFIGLKVPPTERVQSGVSTKAMYRELFRPLFLVFLFCMLLTAATELGPGQWMDAIMKKAAGEGILVLVWIALIMAIGRLFAGPVVHKLSPTGILLGCAVVSIVGLLLVSHATSVLGAYLASAVFAVGVCYFWPTMLGVTSERFPAGGALLMGLMGTAGMISAGFAQPLMGRLLDSFKDNPVLSLRYAAFLPAVLVVIFLIIYLSDRAKGGYKAEKLSEKALEAAALADGEA